MLTFFPCLCLMVHLVDMCFSVHIYLPNSLTLFGYSFLSEPPHWFFSRSRHLTVVSVPDLVSFSCPLDISILMLLHLVFSLHIVSSTAVITEYMLPFQVTSSWPLYLTMIPSALTAFPASPFVSALAYGFSLESLQDFLKQRHPPNQTGFLELYRSYLVFKK